MAVLKHWRDLCSPGCRRSPKSATLSTTRVIVLRSKKWKATASPKCKSRNCNPRQSARPVIRRRASGFRRGETDNREQRTDNGLQMTMKYTYKTADHLKDGVQCGD